MWKIDGKLPGDKWVSPDENGKRVTIYDYLKDWVKNQPDGMIFYAKVVMVDLFNRKVSRGAIVNALGKLSKEGVVVKSTFLQGRNTCWRTNGGGTWKELKPLGFDHSNVVGAIDVREQGQVTRLGNVIGYGNMMHRAQIAWRAMLDKEGLAGGEHVCGPCASATVPCGCEIPHKCDWCCGTEWLTKYVKKIKDEYVQPTKVGTLVGLGLTLHGMSWTCFCHERYYHSHHSKECEICSAIRPEIDPTGSPPSSQLQKKTTEGLKLFENNQYKYCLVLVIAESPEAAVEIWSEEAGPISNDVSCWDEVKIDKDIMLYIEQGDKVPAGATVLKDPNLVMATANQWIEHNGKPGILTGAI